MTLCNLFYREFTSYRKLRWHIEIKDQFYGFTENLGHFIEKEIPTLNHGYNMMSLFNWDIHWSLSITICFVISLNTTGLSGACWDSAMLDVDISAVGNTDHNNDDQILPGKTSHYRYGQCHQQISCRLTWTRALILLSPCIWTVKWLMNVVAGIKWSPDFDAHDVETDQLILVDVWSKVYNSGTHIIWY